MAKRLIDLNPKFLNMHGEPKRTGVGVEFDCPCGCVFPCYVPFENPLDGGPDVHQGRGWKRTGETFDTLTLEPSIQRREPCPKQWHGWIRNGELVNA